ncbi:cell surface protein [Schlesneria sp.]|uniref:cell surface protein n=1 Tax=Schlesneria sp. TaxID=2762018 RepID=UPI002EF01271
MAKSSSQGSRSDTTTEVIPAMPAGIQVYLDRAVGALKKFGVATSNEPTELVKMLDEVKDVDEPKVLAIAKTIQHMSTFNQLVRDNVESINIGTRYLEITQMFDSIREDSKMLIRQLDDGIFSIPERAQNLWMRLRRGTPSARFEKIAELYKSVSVDTKDQLLREEAIMDAYIDFRFALKQAEVLAREVLDEHTPKLLKAQEALSEAQEAVTAAVNEEPGKRSKLELTRDEARYAFEKEDRTYQLLKDIAENLSVGYDVGETLVTKLKQTHDVKDQVYRRSVTFFTTNEHVFTILGTVYTSQQGLNEATKSTEAMKEGVNKGLEDVAELGRELERAAIKAGYGSTIRPESVEKLVTAISDYQIESIEMIAELRRESEQSAQEIRRVVEEGKRRFQETVLKFEAPGSARKLEQTK